MYKVRHANKPKKTRVTLLLSDKAGFKKRKAIRSKERHYTMTKGRTRDRVTVLPGMCLKTDHQNR